MKVHKLNLCSIALFSTLTTAAQAQADRPVEDLWYKCKGCHGMDGKANTAIAVKQKIPDFTSPEWQAQRADEDIRKVIAEGSKKKGSKMKPWKELFTPAEIDSLIPYIRSFKAKEAGYETNPAPRAGDSQLAIEGSHRGANGLAAHSFAPGLR